MRILWVFVITTCCFGVKIWNLIRYIVDFELTPMTPDIVQSVSNLSLHRGYPFIFLATQRIYNPFVWILSVISRYPDGLMRLFVCLFQTLCFCPYCDSFSVTLSNTHRHLATSSNTLSFSLIMTWRVFPKHLKKKLSSSKPVNKRLPRLSLII